MVARDLDGVPEYLEDPMLPMVIGLLATALASGTIVARGGGGAGTRSVREVKDGQRPWPAV